MGCNRPKVEPGEWGRFDFTRWGLDGVPAGDAGQALGALAERLFASPEWRGQVAASLPDLRSRVLQYFDDRGKDLEERRREQAEQVKKRVASIEREREALQERINAAAAPPRLAPDPESYQVAARVIEESSGLGLPGLNLLLLHPQGDKPITQSPTDFDGNAVLVLGKDQASELSGTDLAIHVATANGKVVHKAERAVCPRLGNVETWVASVPAGRDLAPLVAVAEELKNGRSARLAASTEKARLVQADHESWRKEIECDEDDLRAVVDDIKKEESAGRRAPRGEATARKPEATKKRRKT